VVAEALVPPAVLQALQAVAGLAEGRIEARQTEPVKPVPDAPVGAVPPHVLPPLAAMIDRQRLTGIRPGDACVVRPRDIDTGGRPRQPGQPVRPDR
jgi:hypothetical protein